MQYDCEEAQQLCPIVSNTRSYIDGLVQERHNSIANALELMSFLH